MKIDLKKYYEERERLQQNMAFDGPVITLSREYGCEANRIARMVVKNINERPSLKKRHPWQYISKEILDESAKELGINSSQVNHRVQQYDNDPVRAIFSSLGQHYDVSDKKIIDKVNEIILTYARRGNVIIIGRGGNVVTSEIERALRIRLVAPLVWRTEHIAEKMNISKLEAMELIRKMDDNRIKWVEHLTDKPFDDSDYDLIINVRSLNDHEISEMILNLMEEREYIAPASKYAVHA